MLESIGGGLGKALFIGPAPSQLQAVPHWSIQQAIFRRTFTLPQKLPKTLTCTLRVSASTRYRLYVNGHAVLSGPCKGHRWNQYYETLDIAPYLLPGDNAVAIRVTAFPPAESGYEVPGPLAMNPLPAGAAGITSIASDPCLVVEGGVYDGDTLLFDMTTGSAPWQAIADTSTEWIHCKVALWFGSTEQVNGALIPANWRTTARLDWPEAVNRWKPGIDPWGEIESLPLKERPIPLLYEKPGTFVRAMPRRQDDVPTLGFPAATTVPANTAMAVELDAGTLSTAYVHLRTMGGKGARIKLIYAESYWLKDDAGNLYKNMRDDWEHGFIDGMEDIYLPSGGEDEWETFLFRTFRFIRMEVQTAGEPVTVHIPDFIRTAYPLEIKTQLNLSEPWMKELWDLSVHTLEMCIHETHEDCPYYEQMQYVFDTRLHMLFTYAVSGDTRMSRRTIWDFHSGMLPDGLMITRYPTRFPQVIAIFSLYWIFMLEEYYWETGDAGMLRRYRSTIDAMLDYFDRHVGKTGLVEGVGFWDFCDWVPDWQKNDGTPNAAVAGPAAVHNLVYAQALLGAARIAETDGRKGMAAEYRDRANTINRTVVHLCWSPERGMLREGPDLMEFSQHTQTVAVLSGAIKGQRARTALRNAMQGDVLKCTFVWNWMMMRAFDQCGMYDETASFWDLFRKVLGKNLTTLPETPVDTRSDCHAWSAVPLYEFPRVWLGVQPDAPGYKAIRIEPHPLPGVPKMSGTVPSLAGNIHVAWERVGDQLSIHAEAPAVPVRIKYNGAEQVFPEGGSIQVTL